MNKVIQFLKTHNDYDIQRQFGKVGVVELQKHFKKPEGVSWREFMNVERPTPKPLRSHYASKNSYYRVKELEKWSGLFSIPLWADWDEIEEIYKNCPKGYQVDHIVPLKGKYVCGLHVAENLQYLTAKENQSKKHKFDSYEYREK